MRSVAFAVLIFAGILATSQAAPQRIDLGWLESILRANSTVRFGNNTVIITGVANANANTNDGNIQPRPPHDQWNHQNNWNNYRYPYYYGGYWRMVPQVNGEVVEVPQSSEEVSHEISYDLTDEESGEDQLNKENATEEEEDEEQLDEEEEDHLQNEEDDEEDYSQADQSEDASDEAAEQEDEEEIDPEEEAADKELDDLEKDLPPK
ncbi:hypothetical protein KR009_007137 [Drosophila setifemur]|nr:hypothetical protein KR009_007137 [Drosophila setifemur]